MGHFVAKGVSSCHEKIIHRGEVFRVARGMGLCLWLLLLGSCAGAVEEISPFLGQRLHRLFCHPPRVQIVMTFFSAARKYLTFLPVDPMGMFKLMANFVIKHTTILIIPILAKIIIDDLIPSQNIVGIYACVILVALAATTNFFLHRDYSAKVAECSKMASRNLRNRLVQKLQWLSLQYHLRNGAGKMYSKLMVDVEKTERFAELLFNTVTAGVYTFVFSLVTLLLVNAYVTLTFLVFIPVYMLIHRHFRDKFKTLQRKQRMASENLSRSIGQFIETNALSRVHGEEEYEHRKVDRQNVELIETYTKTQRSSASFQVMIMGSSEVFLIIVVAVCAHAIIMDWMKVGALVLFMQYIRQMINAASNLLNRFPEITAFTEAMISIDEVLTVEDDFMKSQGKRALAELGGDIRFEKVCFRYEGQERDLFSNLNVDISSGQTIALVGASGSGKTTFVNLCLGLFQPTSGEVFLDNHPLSALDMPKVRKRFGVVTQTPIIFRGSVMENIAYGCDEVDRDEVVEAAKKANAHEFISNLPDGYDTDLGEQGGALSGGQRQRIAIARSIFRKPSLLILDEATSALDPEAEREVQRGIEGLLGSQTTLVIAHRLSTVFRADRILVFKDGAIVEEGRHNTLIDLKGHYATLLKTQMGIEEIQLEGLKLMA